MLPWPVAVRGQGTAKGGTEGALSRGGLSLSHTHILTHPTSLTHSLGLWLTRTRTLPPPHGHHGHHGHLQVLKAEYWSGKADFEDGGYFFVHYLGWKAS